MNLPLPERLDIPEVCPECHVGKCSNCTGETWDNDLDMPVPCPCAEADHPTRRC